MQIISQASRSGFKRQIITLVNLKLIFSWFLMVFRQLVQGKQAHDKMFTRSNHQAWDLRKLSTTWEYLYHVINFLLIFEIASQCIMRFQVPNKCSLWSNLLLGEALSAKDNKQRSSDRNRNFKSVSDQKNFPSLSLAVTYDCWP